MNIEPQTIPTATHHRNASPIGWLKLPLWRLAFCLVLAIGAGGVTHAATARHDKPTDFSDTTVGGGKTGKPENAKAVVFRPRQAEGLVFFNADHSPVGAYASFVYGVDSATCGLASGSPVMPNTGIILGVLEDGLMPFLNADAKPKPGFIAKNKVRRTLRACSDAWTAPGFSWTHWSPSWNMSDLDTASAAEKRRFFLPATWMTFTLDNRSGTARKTLLFGLPANANPTTFSNGTLSGFAMGVHAFAVPTGACELWDAAAVREKLGLSAGFAFALSAEPGQSRELTVIVSHYDAGPVEKNEPLQPVTKKMLDRFPPGTPRTIGAHYFYASLFRSMDDVVSAAAALQPAALAQCREVDQQLVAAGLNPYRQFLAGHSLHSFRFNTFFLQDSRQRLLWGEPEGGYTWINTLDLTMDHVFCQLAFHPWVTRNVLDQFADTYLYRETLRNPVTGEQGKLPVVSFTHDMGRELRYSLPGNAGYEHHYQMSMAQEELQNWILCAGLYWKKTDDNAWLKKRHALLAECLESMLQRDDADPARRDGVTTFTTQPDGWKEEITTYDALDHALKTSQNSLYITVKSWACYLAMEEMFKTLGDPAAAATARDQAGRCATSVVKHWNADLNYIPAVFDGKNSSQIIPAIEGLAYPAQMGLTNAVALDGPYGPFIQTLRRHFDAVLKPGVCLDGKSGGWKLSSTSENTWQSKVYLSQYVAESVLGMKNDPRITGPVDAVHATFQLFTAKTAAAGWSDQLRSTDGFAIGSLHYPRGATSVLWWLAAPAGKTAKIAAP